MARETAVGGQLEGGGEKMRRRRAQVRNRSGQSIIEYLVVVGAIILAIAAFAGPSGLVTNKITALRTESLNKVDAAKNRAATIDANRH